VFIDGSEIMNLYKTAKKREHITNYNGPPCDANNNPCLNNGQCIPKLNDYTCICTEDYAGKQCELSRTLKILFVDKNDQLRLAIIRTKLIVRIILVKQIWLSLQEMAHFRSTLCHKPSGYEIKPDIRN